MNNTMKKFNARTYLYIAGAGVAIILLLAILHVFIAVSHSHETCYVYIDDDDTRDSVLTKVGAISNRTGLHGLAMLMRHSSYDQHIRTGRYAIEPGDGAFVVFRHLKNGQQKSMNLTIPEARTIDKLAGTLSRKLMLDSLTLAQAMRDSATLKKLGYDTCTISALFVPNTYDIYWNVSADALLQRMKKEHDRFWKGDRQMPWG